MKPTLHLSVLLFGVLALQVPDTAEAQLFGRWRWSGYSTPTTTYYYSGYGWGTSSCCPTTTTYYASSCSSCGCNPCGCTTACSPCSSCSSCSNCSTCSSCTTGNCGFASATGADLKPTPDDGPPQTYAPEGTEEGPAETNGFEGRTEPGPDEFDPPFDGEDGTTEAFKPPVGEGELIPMKKQPPMPKIDEEPARIVPLDDSRAFTWTLTPVPSRVRMQARFGTPVVARTTIDPNAEWESVPATQVARK